jgi:hypothetical protein
VRERRSARPGPASPDARLHVSVPNARHLVWDAGELLAIQWFALARA